MFNETQSEVHEVHEVPDGGTVKMKVTFTPEEDHASKRRKEAAVEAVTGVGLVLVAVFGIFFTMAGAVAAGRKVFGVDLAPPPSPRA